MAQKKHKHRKKNGIMDRSDIPLALRLKYKQQADIDDCRDQSARMVLYAYSVAMHELKSVGYIRLIRYGEVYMALEREFYEDVEVGLDHVKQRLASHGIEISGELFEIPMEDVTIRQQEVLTSGVHAAQVAQIVGCVAMNDVFGYGRDTQALIQDRARELIQECGDRGIRHLLDKMAEIGFLIVGNKPVYFADEDGNLISPQKARKQMEANYRQVKTGG